MKVVKGMVEYGITTTKADYWFHLHPLECRVYYYSVQGFRELIQRVLLRQRYAQKGTGYGYILEKEFVASYPISEWFVSGINWKGLGDEDRKGMTGQAIALKIINRYVLGSCLIFCGHFGK